VSISSLTLHFDQFQVLWDHDTFGMKDFLGSVTLTLEDIRKVSSSDASQSYQLQGVKTGVVEFKVKVISGENEVNFEHFFRFLIHIDLFNALIT
jgi:hypothetical protein